MIRRIHHVGIVVRRLTDAYEFYRETLGLPLVKEAEQLGDELRRGKVSSPAPAAGTSEADLAPGQTAPGYEKRGDHAAGKDGNKDAPIKDDPKGGHR